MMILALMSVLPCYEPPPASALKSIKESISLLALSKSDLENKNSYSSAQESLVVTQERMTDKEAELLLAEIYGRNPRTYDQAIKIYQRYRSETPVKLEMARIYISQKNFSNALETFHDIEEKDLNTQKLQVKMAELEANLGYALVSQRRFKRILAEGPINPEIRLSYAHAMMSWGDFYEAEKIYRELAPAKVVTTFIATDRLLEAEALEGKKYPFKSKESEVEELLYVLDQNACTSQELESLARRYAKAGNAKEAMSLYEAALVKDFTFSAAVGLAELYSAQIQYEKSLAIYNALLVNMPNNPKLLLGQARNLSWNKDYDQSLKAYQMLIELNPENPIPRLEQARVAFWGKEYHLSMNLFDAMLAGDLVPARREEITLERQAKIYDWNWCFLLANDVYRELLELAPDSSTWQFEYAQSLCTLGLCNQVPGYYKAMLDENPLNVYVDLVLTRELQRRRLSTNLNYNYWQEKGYGELSQVGRYETSLVFDVPISCQQHVRVGEHRWLEHTFFDGKYHIANGQSLAWEGRVDANLALRGAVEHKEYLHEFDDTTTYLGVLDLRFNCSTLLIGFTRKNEIYNYFNLKQKTQADVTWGSLETNWNHRLATSALYEHASYSDSNTMQRAVLIGSWAFSDYPKVLKATLTAEWRNTDHTNIFIYNAAGKLKNIIHPYWAPQKYLLGQVLLEWRHDYADLDFCGAPIRFYDIKLSAGTDTQNNPYCALRGEWVHEFFYHWRFSLVGMIHRSPQWNAKGLWATIGYTF